MARRLLLVSGMTVWHRRNPNDPKVNTAEHALYAGMYDGARVSAPQARRAVRLLNPGYDEDDATARRFSQLEID
jgi:hypothetical protein